MTQFSVLSADNAQDVVRWSDVWSQWPAREVFAHPSYLRLFGNEAEQPVCALFESQHGTVLYPFFLRDVQNDDLVGGERRGARDILSPYGYGGAVCIEASDKEALTIDFWNHFDSWCKRSNVVSEFVRFSLFSDSLLDFPGDTEEKQDNIVRSLDLSADDLWMDFEHKVRKNVKKAQRLGVVVEVDTTGEFFDDFYRIYTDTMDRRSASSGYYFDEVFFRAIHNSLDGYFAYFHARHEGRIISTELVLLSEENAYSFLGGTESAAFDMRPNDLLKYEVMMWAGANGKKRFVLGGGYAAGDGIYKYKKAFAPSGSLPFRVGRRILDPVAYDALVKASVARRIEESSPTLPDGYFPAYRG